MSDQGDPEKGKNPEQITILLHPQLLTSFSTRKDFVGDGACVVCQEHVEGDEFMCLNFFCKLCGFNLHVKCATRVPTQKHYLHEHELLCLDKVPSLDCNPCGASTDSSFLRCVLCNFNLHEKCMEVLRVVVNSEVHWNPLTLRESYIDDDSGGYYCDCPS